MKNWMKDHGILTLIMVATAVFAPLLYSLSFVKSMWDPYAGARNLPIAVVNKDQAVTYQKKRFAVGDQTVAQLKKNHALKWQFVSEKQAKEGLKNRQYYTVVTIPRSFSKNATTVLSKHPKKMQLHYTTNDSLNYLAETMSEVGVKSIDASIRSSVTKAYATAMFSQLKTLGKGMTKAANGAQQISDGTVTLSDGTKEYTAGVSKVNNGVQTLKVSVSPLKAGAQQLVSGSGQLLTGLNQYTGGVNTLFAGTNKLVSQNGTLMNGMTTLKSGLGQYTGGVDQLATGTNKLVSNNDTILTGMNTLKNGLGQYTSGVTQLNTGLNTLSSNSAALRAGAGQLQTASGQFGTLNSGAQQVASGVSSFNSALKSSNIVGQLTAALAMQSQVTSLEKQLKDVESALDTLQGIDVNSLKATMDKISNDGAGAWGSTFDIDNAKESVSNDANEIDKLISSDSNMSTATKAKLQEISGDLKSQTSTIQTANSGINNFFTGELMPLQDQLSGIMDQMTKLHNQLPAFQNTMQNAQTLLSETDTLLANLEKNKGLLDAMPGKIALLSSATSQIAAGTQQLADSTGSINTLVAGINQYTNGVDTANAGSNKLDANSLNLVMGFGKLYDGISQYTAGVTQVNTGARKLQANSPVLVTGFGKLYDGVGQYTNGVSLVNTGVGTLNSNSGKLTSGASQLNTALASLNGKVPELISGVNQLATGTSTLDSNSGQLRAGMDKLNAGAGTLADQLGQGAEKVNSTNGSDANAGMFGSPTNLTHTSSSKVPNYGHALAPFAMTTGLFIGVLIFTLEFPARRKLKDFSEAKDVLIHEFKQAILVTLGMVVILNLVMMAAGLKVDHIDALFWISLAYTLAQMAIMQLFTLAFGRFGTIAGLLIFVASIGGAGGMFPMQVTDSFFNTIHPFLPMTYAINGFRQAITGGLGNGYANVNALILWIVAFAFYALFLLVAMYLIENKELALRKAAQAKTTM